MDDEQDDKAQQADGCACSSSRDAGGRFLPGCRGGPGRRPGSRSIPDLLRRIGEEEVQHQGDQLPRLEVVLRQVYDAAQAGQSWAVQFIADRMEGKAVQRQEVDARMETQPIDEALERRKAAQYLVEQGFLVTEQPAGAAS